MPYKRITVPFNPATNIFSAENINKFRLNKRVQSSRSGVSQIHSAPSKIPFDKSQTPVYSIIMTLEKEKIHDLGQYLKTKPVFRAFVFGSYARGDALEKSDIDIILELDYSRHIGLGIVEMKSDIEKIMNKPVDLLTSLSVDPYMKSVIDKDKVLVYERN